jgi:hypothetical protein
MSSADDESDWKFKVAIGKTPVVPLTQASDFPSWHVALRRLVTGCNMADALLYSVPENQLGTVKERVQFYSDQLQKVKQEKESVSSSSSSSSSVASSPAEKASSSPSSLFVDLTDEKELSPIPQSDKELLFMRSLGISKTQDEFFASTIKFVNSRTAEVETEKMVFFRHQIWSWMEQSLAKGTYQWIVKTVQPIFDIHLLYNKVVSLANKATWISHALEFKKIFAISPKMDIFQYHAELIQQIKLVRMQGETLGLNAVIPSWMEQSLLLIAAWQTPQYRKIALEFTMEGRVVSVNNS